jgi:glycosyltransferase involved in cell wall biosynthesis
VAVIGEGPERPDLEQRVRDAGLADRVRFHGEVLDAAACFRAFDLFVSSSRTEGTPIVLFEAIAAGVPVVATSVGGVPDVLGPDQALLVPPEDPSALAAAIREALAEPGAASVRAENAMRRLGEHYALEP